MLLKGELCVVEVAGDGASIGAFSVEYKFSFISVSKMDTSEEEYLCKRMY